MARYMINDDRKITLNTDIDENDFTIYNHTRRAIDPLITLASKVNKCDALLDKIGIILNKKHLEEYDLNDILIDIEAIDNSTTMDIINLITVFISEKRIGLVGNIEEMISTQAQHIESDDTDNVPLFDSYEDDDSYNGPTLNEYDKQLQDELDHVDVATFKISDDSNNQYTYGRRAESNDEPLTVFHESDVGDEDTENHDIKYHIQ